MLKLSLVVMFVLSLATLSFASSLLPMPEDGMVPVAVADAAGPAWIHTFE